MSDPLMQSRQGVIGEEGMILAVTPSDWGNIIRDRRTDLGLSQSDLARKSGMSRPCVVRFENGHAATATVEHIVRLADALDLEIDIVTP